MEAPAPPNNVENVVPGLPYMIVSEQSYVFDANDVVMLDGFHVDRGNTLFAKIRDPAQTGRACGVTPAGGISDLQADVLLAIVCEPGSSDAVRLSQRIFSVGRYPNALVSGWCLGEAV